ncbi:MAG TPA: TrkH family potassium uptake protein [Bacteroidales bacterium]|nr:TrkH family potassium uptake protein [Bacteroidales bacterium]
MINFRVILQITGILLIIEAIAIVLSVPVALYYHESSYFYLLISAIITGLTGLILRYTNQKQKHSTVTKREGYIIVSISWIIFSLFGALPFFLSGEIPHFTDAFFETISGFTTTGATILQDIEAMSKGMLFWRSMTQWLGGMGIIVLSLAVLPILGIGGMQLFFAEVPGPTPDKLHPRIKETAKRLWAIYLILTLAQIVLLIAGGLNVFDAVCHAFTTMATGGYSTKQASIAYYDSPFVQYVFIVFMFLAGTNFTLSYFAMHLRFDKILKNEEFRFYTLLILGFSLVIGLVLYFGGHLKGEPAFRHALFQVVSIMTTTGYATMDYLLWPPLVVLLIFMLMFVGGSAGSTGGGIKVLRVMLLLKNSILEFKRLIHPNAIVQVRLSNNTVQPEVITNILAFVSIYLIITVTGMITVSAMGYDLATSAGAVAATLGNIGPGLGMVGPVAVYAHFPDFGKWFLSFLMLIGRLELFTVLILFSKSFWKK